MKSSSGITLIELTIVMAVMLIVTGVVVTGVNNMPYRHLQNASRRLQADMRYAQRRAIIEGREVVVSFSPRDNRYTVGTPGNIEVFQRVYFRNGVQIGRPDLSNAFVVNYTPRGTVGNSTEIMLYNGELSQRLTVLVASGRVEIFPITQ